MCAAGRWGAACACIPGRLTQPAPSPIFPLLPAAGERRGKILQEVMQLLADGTITTSGGEGAPARCHLLKALRPAPPPPPPQKKI